MISTEQSGLSKPHESAADRNLAPIAFVGAVVGIVCVIAFGLFYGLEVNSDAPHVFGPISHLTTVAFNVLLVPVLWRFHHRLARTGGMQTLWWILVAASLAGALGSLLLVLNVLPLGITIGLSVGAMAVQAVWFVLANRMLLRQKHYPRGLGRYGFSVGAALLGGMIIIVIGLLLPAEAREPFWILGIVIGLFGWVSLPLWLLFAGLTMRRGILSPLPSAVTESA